MFKPADETLAAGRLFKAFHLMAKAAPAIAKIHAAQKAKTLPFGVPEEFAQDAANKNVISAEDAALVRKAYSARLDAIQVDVFTPEQYFGTISRDDGLVMGQVEMKRAVNA